jgi:predicted unusual protein kinase regulating ubiquinone biosynthesis (AarF/ABC1/UbiB family)
VETRQGGGTSSSSSSSPPPPLVPATPPPSSRIVPGIPGPPPSSRIVPGIPGPVPSVESLEALEMEKGACEITSRRYTPALVRERALRTPVEAIATAARGAQIVLAGAGFAAGLVFDKFRAAEDVVSRSDELRILLAELGPSFVKAGQVLANRPDIVRADYMEQLTKLQDDVPPFPNDQAFAIIEGELGRPIAEVYSAISDEPIAAASLGQVYKATLRETGEEVAIKVQRPGIEPIIYRDLVLFRALAFFINAVSQRRLGCNAQLIVDEFGEKLLEELDYVQEGRNLRDFYANFKNDPIVKIPRLYPEQSGKAVLTMEWIEGVRCTDPDGIRAAGIDVDTFIRVGVMSGLRQLLEFGLFHGDPHPGNIFALRCVHELNRAKHVTFLTPFTRSHPVSTNA